ncbi:MAG: hypothetical protein BGN92_00585 [Sphingobacteriales bacterium 41-5]|nr:MAG: hypothetical protein BGN92_00585 [Sphingobacteriales bacterium 41-5]
MNNIVNTISSSVLSKDFKDLSADELLKLSTDHPFSGALQLLYAQKLKDENNGDFALQWQKALLYFNNPLFVHHVLNSATASTQIVEESRETIEVGDQEIKVDQPEIEKGIEFSVDQPEEDQQALNIPGLKIEPIDPAKASLSFTPYHTIDYFASQGIKISNEIKSADKFGNQLKSFTSWLKEMRRLPEAEIISKFSNFEQTKVEKMAETSLTGENAITEAMAQVWIKQNNRQKAIEIYKKLSLQNPAKSAFFAAKIEHLKKQI